MRKICNSDITLITFTHCCTVVARHIPVIWDYSAGNLLHPEERDKGLV